MVDLVSWVRRAVIGLVVCAPVVILGRMDLVLISIIIFCGVILMAIAMTVKQGAV
jgi:hypothetical protein